MVFLISVMIVVGGWLVAYFSRSPAPVFFDSGSLDPPDFLHLLAS
jgi:hypothetical protein